MSKLIYNWSQRLTLAFATGFGLGRMPVASGTFGALLGLPLALALTALVGRYPEMQVGAMPFWLVLQIAICLVLTLLAVPICDAAEKTLGTKDDGRIVADEYLTLPIAVIGLPIAQMILNGRLLEGAALLGTAFVISRICDILKPTPARQSQRIRGGWGIVLDDFFAMVYALILTHGAASLLEKYLYPVLA